ncbi:MAG: hypothetical protein DRN07_02380 [Thermoplasmata archaeon]|nr:MAG: hypothetical protein DRN07_02380 [Thermoplasmata archaeon]
MKKRNLEVCAECSDFPCSKFKSEEEYQQLEESSSYPSYKKVMPNLNFIKKHGIEKFVEQQKKRVRVLETMIENFDDGRSRSFFCKAATLLDLTSLENSLEVASKKIKAENIASNNIKAKAKILKSILNEIALTKGVELVKRKR